jgi:hypothetical protein
LESVQPNESASGPVSVDWKLTAPGAAQSSTSESVLVTAAVVTLKGALNTGAAISSVRAATRMEDSLSAPKRLSARLGSFWVMVSERPVRLFCS